jgi:hypothetical protein
MIVNEMFSISRGNMVMVVWSNFFMIFYRKIRFYGHDLTLTENEPDHHLKS